MINKSTLNGMNFSDTQSNQHTAEVDGTLYEFALSAGTAGGKGLNAVT